MNYITNLNTLSNNTFTTIPAWAKAENLEQSVALDQIWGMSDKAQKQKKHPIRKIVAKRLRILAQQLEEDIEGNTMFEYVKA